MENMFAYAEAFNQPVSFDTTKVTSVRIYVCFESIPNDKDQLLINFLQPYYQMYGMFGYAEAFNQPVSFDTSFVRDVSICLFSLIPYDCDRPVTECLLTT